MPIILEIKNFSRSNLELYVGFTHIPTELLYRLTWIWLMTVRSLKISIPRHIKEDPHYRKEARERDFNEQHRKYGWSIKHPSIEVRARSSHSIYIRAEAIFFRVHTRMIASLDQRRKKKSSVKANERKKAAQTLFSFEPDFFFFPYVYV